MARHTGSVERHDPAYAAEPVAPRDRVLAWLIDWGVIVGWLALMVLVGMVVGKVGVRPGQVGTNVLATVFGVAPVCIGLAALESGPRQATPGKRRLGLVVVSTDRHSRIGFGRALVRNVLKVGVPWTLGHALAIVLVSGAPFTAGLALLMVLAYAMPTGYLATLLVRPHRPVYDWLSGTDVVQRPTEVLPLVSRRARVRGMGHFRDRESRSRQRFVQIDD